MPRIRSARTHFFVARRWKNFFSIFGAFSETISSTRKTDHRHDKNGEVLRLFADWWCKGNLKLNTWGYWTQKSFKYPKISEKKQKYFLMAILTLCRWYNNQLKTTYHFNDYHLSDSKPHFTYTRRDFNRILKRKVMALKSKSQTSSSPSSSSARHHTLKLKIVRLCLSTSHSDCHHIPNAIYFNHDLEIFYLEQKI